MHVMVRKTLFGVHVLRYRATTGRWGVGWARSGGQRAGVCAVLFGRGLMVHRMPSA